MTEDPGEISVGYP